MTAIERKDYDHTKWERLAFRQQRDGLQKLYDETKEDFERACEQCEQLAKYAKHLDGCPAILDPKLESCTCGLFKLAEWLAE